MYLATLTLGLVLLTAPLAAKAQTIGKMPRIGVLAVAPMPTPTTDALRHGLRDLGYVESQNIAIEYRSAGNSLEELPALARELAQLKVDVIVAIGMLATQAARQATETIPIVMGPAGDPVAAGLVASLARPGGNITGVSTMGSKQFAAKRLELIKEAFPAVSRLAVLTHPDQAGVEAGLREVHIAARALGVSVRVVKARGPKELPGAFTEMIQWRAGAVSVMPNPMFNSQRDLIAALALKHRLPTLCEAKELAEAGCTMSFGPSLTDLARRSAAYVDRILKGAKPTDLPVEQPTKFELIINPKTVKALGLTIPNSVLVRADQFVK